MQNLSIFRYVGQTFVNFKYYILRFVLFNSLYRYGGEIVTFIWLFNLLLPDLKNLLLPDLNHDHQC